MMDILISSYIVEICNSHGSHPVGDRRDSILAVYLDQTAQYPYALKKKRTGSR